MYCSISIFVVISLLITMGDKLLFNFDAKFHSQFEISKWHPTDLRRLPRKKSMSLKLQQKTQTSEKVHLIS